MPTMATPVSYENATACKRGSKPLALPSPLVGYIRLGVLLAEAAQGF